MNLVNTYLVLPLQRKIFKNFGHYDYMTNTFHLNEERVNEVFFDPTFNPFVDVLRETSHTSAIASSKSAVQRQPSPKVQLHAKAENQETETRGCKAQPSLPPQVPSATCTNADSNNAKGAQRAHESSSQTNSAAPTNPRRQLPCVQLLEGKIRSAGLVSFLRQATTKKSLAVESIDMIFSVAAATSEQEEEKSVSNTSSSSAAGADNSSSETSQNFCKQASTETRAVSEERLNVDATMTNGKDTSTTSPCDNFNETMASATMARSYSLEDQYALLHQYQQQSGPARSASASPADDGSPQAAPPNKDPIAPPGHSSSSFHTVGDLMNYLKHQLQGFTVGVEEVRLTFCVPPAGTSCSVAALGTSHNALSKGQMQSSLSTANPPLVVRGTRVVHFACRQGLRFTVDEAKGAAVQDMQCSSVINDWQCYLHVMEEDGPVTTTFSLDELIMTTTAHIGVTSDAAAETKVAESAPITVHLARHSASATSSDDASLSSSTAAMSPPRILLDVEATGGWSVVLTAAQVAHLADMAHLITVVTAAENTGTGTLASGTAAAATSPPSLSSRWPADAADALRREVDAAPLESGEAVAAAALAATQLQAAAKYICMHSAGCSVTLLTQSAVGPGVVARAWSGALPPQQLSFLATVEDRKGETSSIPRSRDSVFNALASPHFTYVMRDMDILFPNIESGVARPAALSRVFAADRKKRAIYRNLFRNNLADRSVTEQLERARQCGLGDGAQSVFLGIGSIALLEYRQVAANTTLENVTLHKTLNLLHPAQVLYAKRTPYALVVLHRSAPPLPQSTESPASSTALGVDQPPQAFSYFTSPPPQQQMCVHHETIAVGLASISVQLDPELLELLTTYAMTLAKLTRSFARPAVYKRSTSTPPLQRTETAGTQGVANRCSVKVLLEKLEASVRFPLHPLSIHDDSTAVLPASSPSFPPPTATTPPVALPSFLTRLLQRLRETSLNIHRQLRAELVRQARNQSDGIMKSLQSDAIPPRSATEEASEKFHLFPSVQWKLGFPEDMYGKARFLPEMLCFSIRDLQIVQTQSSCDLAKGNMPEVFTANPLHEPLSISVKWREAVVWMHDVLEDTKSELFRGDFTPEMSICVTHTCLSDETTMNQWQALRRVLTLQVRLGDVTTSVLTQDDYLLASYYVQRLLQTLAHCRQRLHSLSGEDTLAESTPQLRSTGAERTSLNAASTVTAVNDDNQVKAVAAPPLHEKTEVTSGRERSSGPQLHSADSIGGMLAEAFAIADAHKKMATSFTARHGCDAHTPQEAQGISSSFLQGNSELPDLIPDLWCSVESTCTALDVQIGRVQVGLFAPRLSPMGEVVGEPLFRCLPAAQRRQIVDLNCLYHTYIVEVVGVSVRGLIGSGALVGKGQDTYLRARFDGFSMWERQPWALRVSGGECGRDTGASGATVTAAVASSLYSSYVSGVMQPPPNTSSPPRMTADKIQRSSTTSSASGTIHHGGGAAVGSEPRARRDLGYYLSNQQHRGSALVQLIQSYTEVNAPTGVERDGEDEDGERVDADKNRGGERDRLRLGERFLRQLWSAYLRELKTRIVEETQSSSAEKVSMACSALDVGVCEVRLLEYTTGGKETPTSLSSDAHKLRDSRYVTIQLTGLGLHHTVSYNGDHLAAVLRSFFSGGGSMAPTTEETADIPISFSEQTAVSTKPSSGTATPTVIHVVLNNLLATYRPCGVGRSLAVVLLPHASVLVNTKFNSIPHGAEKSAKGNRAAAESSSAQLPLVMQGQAWLHTSVPIYVCNDCDVEALAREVLDPMECNDWGVDLEGAGFVRLCEVISTAPLQTANGDVPAQLQHRQTRRCPNLTIMLPLYDAAASAAQQDGNENSRANNSNVMAGSEEVLSADLDSAVAVRVRYVDLSAFMAKDAFDVFRELVETWAAGTDLQALDTPAALVMRSGPGFEWVAGEVARSCAPMTFQLNPELISLRGSEKDDQELLDGGEHGTQFLTDAEGGVPPVSHSSRPYRPSALHHSYTASSPPLAAQDLVLSTGSATTTDVVPAEASSTLPTYGYSKWRDALHAAQGQDQRLSEAYQSRVAKLLDPRSPWVPVRRFGTHNKDDVADAGGAANAFAPLSSPSQTPLNHAATQETFFIQDNDEKDETQVTSDVATQSWLSRKENVVGLYPNTSFAAPRVAATGVSSVSSSFSDLSDLDTSLAPLQWRVVPSPDPNADSSETVRHVSAAALVRGVANVMAGDDKADDVDFNGGFDLCAACERQPHFLSCWSHNRADASSQSSPVSFNHLERTDDALLHDTAERYLYPPVELQVFLCDCALNVSLYEGTDLMAAAVRKQRQGYLQIVSRGARVTHAAVPYSMESPHDDQREDANEAEVAAASHRDEDLWPSFSRSSVATTVASTGTSGTLEPPSESSASRLSRLSNRGCRSGFGDRDASKRLVLVCRGITVQLNTFPQASDEDLWFHIVISEATVFDCIETSDVHRLLTATTPSTSATSAAAKRNSQRRAQHRNAQESCSSADVAKKDARQLELTGLLTSSKSVHIAALQQVTESARVGFTMSHFQQGGSELSLVVRMQPMSLTWSGASMDFAQSFFFSSAASVPPSPAASSEGGRTVAANTARVSGASLKADTFDAAHAPSAASTAAMVGVIGTNDGIITGTEAPPIFFRRIVILPTTVTIAGSFQGSKGVLAALAEGKSLEALRSVPVLSWISVQEIPLPIPFMRIEDCSSAVMLLQRIVEDSNCVSVRFLLTAFCCGLQPLSAVARVGEAAKGLLLLPLSQYRGAALHHAIRTASSVFMQELLTQTSGVAALLASGSYHASRSLLEALVPPSDRRLHITAEPSRASQPAGLGEGWQQAQEQLRTGLEEALTMASYCTGPDGSLLRLPAAALRMLMGISGAATTTLWGVRNSQNSAVRDRDGYIYKK